MPKLSDKLLSFVHKELPKALYYQQVQAKHEDCVHLKLYSKHSLMFNSIQFSGEKRCL